MLTRDLADPVVDGAARGLWIVYGVRISAIPVVVANGLVFAAAAWTMLRSKPREIAAS